MGDVQALKALENGPLAIEPAKPEQEGPKDDKQEGKGEEQEGKGAEQGDGSQSQGDGSQGKGRGKGAKGRGKGKEKGKDNDKKETKSEKATREAMSKVSALKALKTKADIALGGVTELLAAIKNRPEWSQWKSYEAKLVEQMVTLSEAKQTSSFWQCWSMQSSAALMVLAKKMKIVDLEAELQHRTDIETFVEDIEKVTSKLRRMQTIESEN